jgi:diketogulonate reductase-like aldo/keto reductase
MATATTRRIELNNGVDMPALGLGVFQSPPAETVGAVETAIADGYRLIDTAAAYGNERGVGEGVRRSGLDRDEMFVLTKLWISDYGYEPALRGFEGCLRRLGLDYVDLFLLHHPVPSDFGGTVAAYQAAEQMLADGRARAIGVSNFSAQHLERLLSRTDVVPAVNQVELHPFFAQQALRDFHAANGIVTQAWSPLGGVNRYRPADADAVKNRSSTRRSSSSRRSTRRRRRRSFSAGTSSTASPRSRSRSCRTASQRTSTSSTSGWRLTTSRRSTPSTPACVAAPTPSSSTPSSTRSESKTEAAMPEIRPTAIRGRRHHTRSTSPRYLRALGWKRCARRSLESSLWDTSGTHVAMTEKQKPPSYGDFRSG